MSYEQDQHRCVNSPLCTTNVHFVKKILQEVVYYTTCGKCKKKCILSFIESNEHNSFTISFINDK